VSKESRGGGDGGPRIRRTGRRRVTTDPVPGTDPAPQKADGSPVERAAEDADESWGGGRKADDKNDERLKRDKPPHWG
jgi:high-mobility group nucleosome-binding domain-containing protein 2